MVSSTCLFLGNRAIVVTSESWNGVEGLRAGEVMGGPSLWHCRDLLMSLATSWLDRGRGGGYCVNDVRGAYTSLSRTLPIALPVKQERGTAGENWAIRCKQEQAKARPPRAAAGSPFSVNTTDARVQIVERRTQAGLAEFEQRYNASLTQEAREARARRHEGRKWRRREPHSREWNITTRAAELVALMRKLRFSSSEFERSQAVAASMAMPGGGMRDADDPSCVDALLDRAQGAVPVGRADTSWKTWGETWLQARDFLRDAMECDGKPWTAQTLRQNPKYIVALAQWCFETNASATGVEKLMGSVSMALRVNSIRMPPLFYVQMIKSASKRTRGRPIRKRRGLAYDEAAKIVSTNGWCGPNSTLADRMIAVAMAIGFACLLRFVGLASIIIGGIYWVPAYWEGVTHHLGGCVIILAQSKTDQIGRSSQVAIADTGREDSLVQRIKDLCADLGVKIPDGYEGFVDSKRFLFRDMTVKGTSTHKSCRVYVVDMEGRRPMASGGKAYSHYKTRMRQAIQECCGYSTTQAREFGTQGLRAGGDTHLFNMGVPASVRMSLGRWNTPSVERGYLRIQVQQRVAFMQSVGL